MQIIRTENISDCINKAADIASNYSQLGSKPCYIFCDDQITLSVESKLASTCGEGFFNIAVTTFYNYVSLNNKGAKVLSSEASAMVIRKIIGEVQDKLQCFKNIKNNPNLSIVLFNLISQIKSAQITPEILSDTIRDNDNDMPRNLLAKLKDISNIYSLYENYLKDNNLYDQLGYVGLMPSLIEKDECLKGAVVLLVGYPSVTKQRLEVFKKLDLAASECYAICLANHDSNIFTNETYDKLCSLPGNNKIDEYITEDSEEVSRLKKYLFNPVVFNKLFNKMPTNKISIVKCDGINEEVESLAKDIVKEIKSGKRFKNIAVTVGDLSLYKYKIQKIFPEYNIPYYMDVSTKLSAHPLCTFIDSYIDLVRRNLEQEDYIKFIQSDLFDTNKTLVDEYTTYIRANSLKHKKFLEPLLNLKDKEYFERYREKIAKIYTKLSLAKTANEYIKCIRDLIVEFDVETTLNSLGEILSKEQQYVYEDFNKKAVEKLDGVLTEISEILGDTKIDLLEFKNILKSGTNALLIETIPLFQDAVFIGECKDVRMKKALCLYAIGISGDIPFVQSDTAILSDSELSKLDGFDVVIEPKVKIINNRERENVCLTFTSFTEKLRISYSSISSDGKPTPKSDIIKYILALFDINEVADNSSNLDNCSSLEGIVREVAKRKGSGEKIDKTNSDYVNVLEALEELKSNDFDRNITPGEAQENIQNYVTKDDRDRENIADTSLSFKGGEIAVTTLEKYFNCPYSNFAQNQLGLKEVEDGEIQYSTIGTIYHKLVEDFMKEINNPTLNIDLFVEQKMDEILLNDKYLSLTKNVKFPRTKKVLVKEGKKACNDLFDWSKKSEFKTYGTEVKFNDNEPEFKAINLIVNGTDNYKVRGMADRVDIYNDEYLRIIDYKSGTVHDGIDEFFTGRALQLYLYLNAFTNGRYKVAGAYYMPINDDVFGSVKEQVDGHRMRGYTLNNNDIIKASDNAIQSGIKSDIVNITLKKDGTPDSHSKVLSEEEFDSFLKYARRVAEGAASEIKQGYIRPIPYQGSCEYCKFRGMCGHVDGVDKTRKINKVSTDTIINSII